MECNTLGFQRPTMGTGCKTMVWMTDIHPENCGSSVISMEGICM